MVSDRMLDRPVQRVTLRGTRIAYWRAGHGGIPLLLVHGWPSTRRIWARNIEDLAARGFDVVVPDLRGFGDSDVGADGLHDVVAHSLDMAALVEHLGLIEIVAAGGDLGAAVIQDLSLRYPGLVERLIIFNGPLPNIKKAMRHLPPVERRFEDLHGYRPATEPELLMAELATPRARMSYVASHYRKWSPAHAFSEADLNYLAEPFADPDKLRASFGTYESLIDPAKRAGRSMINVNNTRTLILYAMADRLSPITSPAWDKRAAIVFPNHIGPFGLIDAGHFAQWEAADLVNIASVMFCADRLPRLAVVG